MGLGQKCIGPFSLIYFFLKKITEDYAEECCLSAGSLSALNLDVCQTSDPETT